MSASPPPAYQAPPLNPVRPGLGSGRTSFTKSPLPLALQSPRTLCPRDSDTYSFNPAYLPRWYVEQHVWDSLPAQLQSALAEMQHAGAAVLTGIDPLDVSDPQW